MIGVILNLFTPMAVLVPSSRFTSDALPSWAFLFYFFFALFYIFELRKFFDVAANEVTA